MPKTKSRMHEIEKLIQTCRDVKSGKAIWRDVHTATLIKIVENSVGHYKWKQIDKALSEQYLQKRRELEAERSKNREELSRQRKELFEQMLTDELPTIALQLKLLKDAPFQNAIIKDPETGEQRIDVDKLDPKLGKLALESSVTILKAMGMLTTRVEAKVEQSVFSAWDQVGPDEIAGEVVGEES